MADNTSSVAKLDALSALRSALVGAREGWADDVESWSESPSFGMSAAQIRKLSLAKTYEHLMGDWWSCSADSNPAPYAGYVAAIARIADAFGLTMDQVIRSKK